MEEEIRALMQKGNWTSALPLAQSFYEQEGSFDSRSLLITCLSALEKNEEALPLAREVYEKTRGLYSREALEAGNNLARLAYRSGHFQEAVLVGRDALADFSHVFGKEHPATLQMMENLARYQAADSNLHEALATIQAALDIWGDQPDNEAMLSALLTSMEILNRITLERFLAFYGSDATKTIEAKKRLGIN